MVGTAVFSNLLKVSCSVVVVGGGVLLVARVSTAHTVDIYFFTSWCQPLASSVTFL